MGQNKNYETKTMDADKIPSNTKGMRLDIKCPHCKRAVELFISKEALLDALDTLNELEKEGI